MYFKKLWYRLTIALCMFITVYFGWRFRTDGGTPQSLAIFGLFGFITIALLTIYSYINED